MRATSSALYQTTICITLLCLTLFCPLGFTQQVIDQRETAINGNAPLQTTQKWTFILVRHGEKQPGDDPQLTKQGTERAERLAQMLQHIPLDKVYSTDYQRTQLTAQPTAIGHHLPITSYDPSDLDSFSQQLFKRPGSYLIVGHSNTTAILAHKLNQPSVNTDPDHAEEFDRLYFIEVNIVDGKRINSMYRFSY
ncbi:histidine phosphatase family protein [Shewanella sp. HL-SH4]|uniref:histidine phosphatase family protein n=1 Tax=Shewanella sp. HL-SH4 TaxID=3436240 RepID=UPI003EB9C4C2